MKYHPSSLRSVSPLKLRGDKGVILSVVLATRNEEANLTRCLEAVKSIANEIIIADEQSTDKTVGIAKKFGAKVISVPHQENFHITKNIAIDAARGDWILQLDADEVERRPISGSHSPPVPPGKRKTSGQRRARASTDPGSNRPLAERFVPLPGYQFRQVLRWF
ncbi:MAG: Glycosyltransferases involved in cell wall biogenesis [Candidatus Amesbacteria bacterium GW2011_GWA2_47_70]|nr:MAG: Glycosyltransferases involved in cell wall biogenesis [Candidatus Amesbacteria bacterium GW2011_GWA2_47_70]